MQCSREDEASHFQALLSALQGYLLGGTASAHALSSLFVQHLDLEFRVEGTRTVDDDGAEPLTPDVVLAFTSFEESRTSANGWRPFELLRAVLEVFVSERLRALSVRVEDRTWERGQPWLGFLARAIGLQTLSVMGDFGRPLLVVLAMVRDSETGVWRRLGRNQEKLGASEVLFLPELRCLVLEYVDFVTPTNVVRGEDGEALDTEFLLSSLSARARVKLPLQRLVIKDCILSRYWVDQLKKVVTLVEWDREDYSDAVPTTSLPISLRSPLEF
ncbi:hypothetical protein BV25DRAFT_1820361 [Artomyces pyxidatus]|uniref:Uncharacterized protein n=1 Tax=Artomyces pyxidatus TaxID=48021 RepID=A0ACB8TCM9_9AGAM|nr:hypothetical protein BV25DRAFT_1820361 [Artomyces pyxidatus]